MLDDAGAARAGAILSPSSPRSVVERFGKRRAVAPRSHRRSCDVRAGDAGQPRAQPSDATVQASTAAESTAFEHVVDHVLGSASYYEMPVAQACAAQSGRGRRCGGTAVRGAQGSDGQRVRVLGPVPSGDRTDGTVPIRLTVLAQSRQITFATSRSRRRRHRRRRLCKRRRSDATIGHGAYHPARRGPGRHPRPDRAGTCAAPAMRSPRSATAPPARSGRSSRRADLLILDLMPGLDGLEVCKGSARASTARRS